MSLEMFRDYDYLQVADSDTDIERSTKMFSIHQTEQIHLKFILSIPMRHNI